ncbi:RDD family protein [Actinomyces sp.]|uniref:RDD family protein n=1 Tax=Actinomyces sp. TaxID=29317 RepID=UPI0026DC0D65|nr:RDD family protein [Actinomyces sp.]MDO4901102.1 RDD family protein [Actinomyces sp.]
MTTTPVSRSPNYRSVGTPSAPPDPTDTAPMGTPAITVPATARARVYAGLIDLAGGALACLVLAVAGSLLGVRDVSVSLAVALVIVVAVRELVLAATGWTLGGRVAGVRLLSTRTGQPPKSELFLHADLTFICIVPTFGIGAIVLIRTVATDPEGRGWHDRLTGIKAVTVSRSPTPSPLRPGPDAASVDTTGHSPFSDGRFSFTSSGTPLNEVSRTVDTTRTITPSSDARSAVIDSVPWAAVPTPLDSTTDDAPAVFGADDQLPGAPSAVSRSRTAAPRRKRTDAPTRRRRATSHRKPDTAEIRIRLVPTDGGDPIELTMPTVLGRDPQNISEYPDAARVAVPDVSRSISKTHAAVAPVPGGLWVTDLHSTNGTRVSQGDGAEPSSARPEMPVPAPVGSVLILGRASFRIEE